MVWPLLWHGRAENAETIAESAENSAETDEMTENSASELKYG